MAEWLFQINKKTALRRSICWRRIGETTYLPYAIENTGIWDFRNTFYAIFLRHLSARAE
jgi:hypothetical protein